MAQKQSDWYGSSLETEGKPLVDAGIGRPLMLRTFEFAIKPGQTQIPTRQELFNAHWPHMKTLIWADGLIANMEVAPRVVIGKRRYRIFILCEPRFNKHGIKLIPGKPKTLQEVFKKPS